MPTEMTFTFTSMTVSSAFLQPEQFYKDTRVPAKYQSNSPHIALEKMAIEHDWENVLILLEDLSKYRNQIGQNLIESFSMAIQCFDNVPCPPSDILDQIKEIEAEFYS